MPEAPVLEKPPAPQSVSIDKPFNVGGPFSRTGWRSEVPVQSESKDISSQQSDLAERKSSPYIVVDDEAPPTYHGVEGKMDVLNRSGDEYAIPFHVRLGSQQDTLPFKIDPNDPSAKRIIIPEDIRTDALLTDGAVFKQKPGGSLSIRVANMEYEFSSEDLSQKSALVPLNGEVKIGVTRFNPDTGVVEVFKIEEPKRVTQVVNTLRKSNWAKKLVPFLPIPFLIPGSEPGQPPPAHALPEIPAIEQPAVQQEIPVTQEVEKLGRKVDYTNSKGPESFAGHVVHDLARAQSEEIRTIEGTNPDGSPTNPLLPSDDRYQLVDKSVKAFLREQTGTDNEATQRALLEKIVEMQHDYVIDPDGVVNGDTISQGGVFWYKDGMPDAKVIADEVIKEVAREVAEIGLQSSGVLNNGPTR